MTRESYAEYLEWLKKNGIPDNGFNLYRFRHGFTNYRVAKMLGLGQTIADRYSKTTKENLTQSATALFLVLNKLDEMKESGSLKISSVDLF